MKDLSKSYDKRTTEGFSLLLHGKCRWAKMGKLGEKETGFSRGYHHHHPHHYYYCCRQFYAEFIDKDGT